MAHTKGGIRLAFQDDEYQIVYASDDGYAEALGVSLTSLFENNQDAKSIQVTILDSGISSKNHTRIEEVCLKYNRSLPRWVKAVDIEKHLSIRVNLDRGSLSQYARIFLNEVYDSDIERVLYLDCDTLIVSSIANLWNMSLQGNIIAALKDAFSAMYRRNIDLQKEDVMFNSGVMLVDLNQWRKQRVEKYVLDFILSKNGKVQQGDQGALNAVLSRKTKVLDPQYNLVSIFFDLTYAQIKKYRKPVDFYTKNEIENAKKNPVIIHFTSSFYNRRPWFQNSNHVKASQWLDYRNKGPWCSELVSRDTRSGMKKIVYDVYHHIPRGLSLTIAGILQAYVRPMKYRVTGR